MSPQSQTTPGTGPSPRWTVGRTEGSLWTTPIRPHLPQGRIHRPMENAMFTLNATYLIRLTIHCAREDSFKLLIAQKHAFLIPWINWEAEVGLMGTCHQVLRILDSSVQWANSVLTLWLAPLEFKNPLRFVLSLYFCFFMVNCISNNMNFQPH
jgi:hypothetical protein